MSGSGLISIGICRFIVVSHKTMPTTTLTFPLLDSARSQMPLIAAATAASPILHHIVWMSVLPPPSHTKAITLVLPTCSPQHGQSELSLRSWRKGNTWYMVHSTGPSRSFSSRAALKSQLFSCQHLTEIITMYNTTSGPYEQPGVFLRATSFVNSVRTWIIWWYRSIRLFACPLISPRQSSSLSNLMAPISDV